MRKVQMPWLILSSTRIKHSPSESKKKEVRNARYMRCHNNNNNCLILKKMPKVKTNSAAKKRFSFTGSGKIKRRHAFHSHILTKKTKKQKRNLLGSTIVDSTNTKQVRDLLRLR